tara:strand:- start:734 stop:1351 length:618 start_codon:yes stop_codon:yes gene_type:complete
MKKCHIFLGILLAVTGVVSSAGAVTIDADISGDFDFHNDILTVDFTLDTDRMVTFFTSSWITGGADAVLFLWDSAGNWLGSASGYNDDASTAGSELSGGVSYSYGEFDVLKQDVTLGAGDYIATLSITGNYPVGYPGVGNLSAGYGWDLAAPVPITDGHYDFHMVGISSYTVRGASAPIPEPTTLALMTLGGSLLALRRKFSYNA